MKAPRREDKRERERDEWMAADGRREKERGAKEKKRIEKKRLEKIRKDRP